MIRFLSTCERPSPCSSPYVLPTQNNWPFFEHISLAHASSSWLLCTHLYCNLVPLEKTSLTSLKRPSCSLLNSYVHYACCLASVMSNSLGPHGLQPTRLLCPWNFPSENTGISCHFLLQFVCLLSFQKLSPLSIGFSSPVDEVCELSSVPFFVFFIEVDFLSHCPAGIFTGGHSFQS